MSLTMKCEYGKQLRIKEDLAAGVSSALAAAK